MKKLIYLSIIFIGLSVCPLSNVNAQGVGINSSGNPPDPSAILDASSTTKGTLITRMTTSQRDAISSPVNGLLIFNTDCGNFNYYFNGAWLPLNNAIMPAAAGTITGSATVCLGQSNVSYSVPAIANATSYTWSYSGTGATISGSTNPITINFSGSATSGNLTVMGSNACGNGTISTSYAIAVNQTPALPAATTHTPSLTQIIWNWNAVSGATGYKWGTTNVYSSSTDNGAITSYTQTGLTCNTGYTLYIWAYNACGNSSYTTLTQTTSACANACNNLTTMTDSRDSKVYNIVAIGNQCWMQQNLNYSTSGTFITGVTEQTNNGSIEKYCYGNSAANCTTYGGMYQWAEMVQYLNGATKNTSWNPVPAGNVQGICPAGWHIPTDTEWSSLENFLGGSSVAGGKMKATSSNTPAWDGSNISGFLALPAGYCDGANGSFGGLNSQTTFWLATEFSTNSA